MIVGPWGVVLAQAPEGECHTVAELDFEREPRCARARRRWRTAGEAYRWPVREAVQIPGRAPSVERSKASRKAPPDPRRGRARVRPPGLSRVPLSDIADEAGVAYGLVYSFASKDEVLDTLFLERWEVMLELIRESTRHDPGAREARRDRVVHHRQLPPRSRPDEGDHRRGHARGELVRRHAHRHDPRGLRADRRDRSKRLSEGEFKAEIERALPRWPSTA